MQYDKHLSNELYTKELKTMLKQKIGRRWWRRKEQRERVKMNNLESDFNN